MASFFDRQASMASLPPDEVEFELDLEVSLHLHLHLHPLPQVGGGAGGGLPERPQLGRRDSAVFDSSRLTADELVQLNSVLDHVLDVMGESVPEHVIKATIVRSPPAPCLLPHSPHYFSGVSLTQRNH